MSDKPFTLPAVPLPPANPNMERQTGTGSFTAIKVGGWVVDGSKIKKGNITIDSANEKILIGPIAGNHLSISGDTITVYSGDETDPANLVATFGAFTIGGLVAGLLTTIAHLDTSFYTAQGLTLDFYALPTDIGGAVGDDTGTLTISTRLASGGGDIVLVPPASGVSSRVSSYVRHRIVPQSSAPDNPVSGDLWNDSSGGTDTAKLKVYTGGSWVVVGTQT